MFLLVKNKEEICIALESTEAVVSVLFASLKEEYNGIELDITFNSPNCKIEKNIVRFINLLNGDSQGEKATREEIQLDSTNEENTLEANSINIDNEEEIKVEEEKTSEEDSLIEIEEVEAPSIEIEEKPSIEIVEEVKEASKVIEEPKEVEEIEIEEVKPVVVKRVDPAERALEKIREQQREEGLPKLDNKVNTLEYRRHLENFMKLGFTASVLSKKGNDINDREIKGKIAELYQMSMKRVENYEEQFRKIGLTTAQIHTFRMEALREVKKYRDSSYEEVYKYLRKLYTLSEDLIK
ncbi:MAG: hypothetical protein ACRDD2_08360, partial [Sarcina sp.]